MESAIAAALGVLAERVAVVELVERVGRVTAVAQANLAGGTEPEHRTGVERVAWVVPREIVAVLFKGSTAAAARRAAQARAAVPAGAASAAVAVLPAAAVVVDEAAVAAGVAVKTDFGRVLSTSPTMRVRVNGRRISWLL